MGTGHSASELQPQRKIVSLRFSNINSLPPSSAASKRWAAHDFSTVQRTEQQGPYLWPPNASAPPLPGISPRTSSGHATWAHPPDRVGVPAGLWADVVPVDVGIPRQARSTQRQPTEGLVGAGDPGVNLTTGSTYPLGVDPFARRRNRVPHLITMPDQVSRNVSELVQLIGDRIPGRSAALWRIDGRGA